MTTTPICSISEAGIYKPDFATVLAYFVAGFQGIYGADTYLGSDSQDGELVGFLATVLDDCNAEALNTYNSFSPTTAQGAGLSSNVKINNLKRGVPSYSVATLTLVGTYSTVISNGVVQDVNGNNWTISPTSVVIPYSGTIDVSATCQQIGAIAAPPGTITKIFTQTLGWQSVTNASAATPGAPVELDGSLRIRQSQSAAIPSQTGMGGLVGAVLAVTGVTSVTPYENETGVTDANGLPPHSYTLVIDGGTMIDIATAMLMKKMIGATPYGTTSQTLNDPNGIPRTMKWFVASLVPITMTITLTPGLGYTADVATAIKQQMVAWVNNLGDGTNVSLSRSYTPANSVGTSYEIMSIVIGSHGGAEAASDAAMLFYESPNCADITSIVVID